MNRRKSIILLLALIILRCNSSKNHLPEIQYSEKVAPSKILKKESKLYREINSLRLDLIEGIDKNDYSVFRNYLGKSFQINIQHLDPSINLNWLAMKEERKEQVGDILKKHIDKTRLRNIFLNMKVGLVYKDYDLVYLREVNFQPSNDDRIVREGVHFYLKNAPINVVLGTENNRIILKKIEQIYFMEP